MKTIVTFITICVVCTFSSCASKSVDKKSDCKSVCKAVCK